MTTVATIINVAPLISGLGKNRGSTIRKQTGIPWIVLHHVSPKTGSSSSGEELEAAELLSAYRPDYFVSGHNHSFPYTFGRSWNQKTGESRLLVPGQLLGAPFPNNIKLDTESGELTWHTTSKTWIPAKAGNDAIRHSPSETLWID